MLQNWKGSNSHASYSLFVSFHLYMIYAHCLFLFIYIWYIDLESAILTPIALSLFFFFGFSFVILLVTLCMWYKKMEQQQRLHFSHSKHPLVYLQHFRGRATCFGCQESVYGPSYFCPNSECSSWHCHHKLCAEVPLGLHHPLHPLHPLILFDEKTGYLKKENSTCQVCNESRNEYTYRCYHCNFNLHIKCVVLQLEAEFHDHPLTPIGKTITFTCDICGKEGKGVPNLCATCCFWIHRSCASFPRRLKVVHHKHPLHITHSSLELRESDFQFCLLCVQKVDTCYGLYYCSKCDFVSHLNCAIDWWNREDINLLELKGEENEDAELDQSIKPVAIGGSM